MSRIRSKNTALEAGYFELFKEVGIRFRKHPKGIFGNPDAANKSKKIALFVDSDFWHGRNWNKKRRSIKANRDFWIEKIERNMRRDKTVNRMLKKSGWKVIRVWGNDLRKKYKAKTLNKLKKLLD